jgi:hypothetical protein
VTFLKAKEPSLALGPLAWTSSSPPALIGLPRQSRCVKHILSGVAEALAESKSCAGLLVMPRTRAQFIALSSACVNAPQAELAGLLSATIHGSEAIDLNHPQYTVISTSVAKATASVLASFRAAAMEVLLPHLEAVDTPADAFPMTLHHLDTDLPGANPGATSGPMPVLAAASAVRDRSRSEQGGAAAAAEGEVGLVVPGGMTSVAAGVAASATHSSSRLPTLQVMAPAVSTAPAATAQDVDTSTSSVAASAATTTGGLAALQAKLQAMMLQHSASSGLQKQQQQSLQAGLASGPATGNLDNGAAGGVTAASTVPQGMPSLAAGGSLPAADVSPPLPLFSQAQPFLLGGGSGQGLRGSTISGSQVGTRWI